MKGPPRPVVGLAACIYGPILLVAGLWVWLRGDESWIDELLATEVPIWQALGAGLAIGLLAVLVSRWTSRSFGWARRLEMAFIGLLGPLTIGQIVFLALSSSIAEEALFRGAMQADLGLIATSLIFGILHTGPLRTFWPWTLMALMMGFVLGGLRIWTGGLLAPCICHLTINLLNLHDLSLKAKRQAA